MGSADIRHDEPAEKIFALPPVDLDELALGLCVTLDDARQAGAAFARLLCSARPEAPPAALEAICAQVAQLAATQTRQGVSVALQVDREALWQSIKVAFATGAKAELERSPA